MEARAERRGLFPDSILVNDCLSKFCEFEALVWI
ncbi:hypothetical protein J2857_001896 [Neorhizobium galegae]|nr:hypothetical protein [Neorhizobium galegae]